MRRRSLQIASNIQRELQNRLARGLSDPRIRGMITVTKVELSDDLKNAKAFVTVLPEDRAKLTMHGLVSATGKIRKEVMQRIHIKEMPTLRFVYDEGHKAQMQVFALLEKDRREQEARSATRAAADDGQEAHRGDAHHSKGPDDAPEPREDERP